MMIVVTLINDRKAAINTEKIIFVKRFDYYSSIIYCADCEPQEVTETPEEIAEMFNNKY